MKRRSSSSTSARVTFPDHQKIQHQLTYVALQALKRNPRIATIYLFGSRATQMPSARSDADLLIVLQHDPRSRRMDRIPEFLRLFLDAPVPVDVFPFTKDEIKKSAFARQAIENGILLAGRPDQK